MQLETRKLAVCIKKGALQKSRLVYKLSIRVYCRPGYFADWFMAGHCQPKSSHAR